MADLKYTTSPAEDAFLASIAGPKEDAQTTFQEFVAAALVSEVIKLNQRKLESLSPDEVDFALQSVEAQRANQVSLAQSAETITGQ